MDQRNDAWVSNERFLRAVIFTILLIGVLYAVISALPLKKAYPVRLSDDISAILVKSGPRTIVDVIPESVMSGAPANPEWAKNPLQKQAILNAYGVALKTLGEKTRRGYIVTKNEKDVSEVGRILTAPVEGSNKGREIVWVNNITFPEIEIPSILVSANGNSDTLALALYFLEELTGKEWNRKFHFKITGALSDSLDDNLVTSIGEAENKSLIKLEKNEILFMPLGNRYDLKERREGIRFIGSFSGLISEICSLPYKGELCSDTRIKPILATENVKKQSERVLQGLSTNQR